MPVIAAVHGVAFGGGFQLAMGTDIRYVAPDAQLSVMEVKWGLIPDMTGSQSLRRLVRLDVAKELTFTGRIVSGQEALELGLATHLSDAPRDAALALAREIAKQSPDAIRAAILHALNAERSGKQHDRSFSVGSVGGHGAFGSLESVHMCGCGRGSWPTCHRRQTRLGEATR